MIKDRPGLDQDPPTTAAEAVDRGVDWLDANRPGWAQKLDLVRLDIENSEWCVLGQLESAESPQHHRRDFWDSAESEYGLSWCMVFGFYAHSNPVKIEMAGGMALFLPGWNAKDLTRAWVERVSQILGTSG